MRRETLERMTEGEIDELGKTYGIELAPCTTLEEKIDMIERRRSRSVFVTVFGIDFEIPIKRAHDKRIADIMNNPVVSETDADEVFRLLLGDAQTRKLVDACTDDDGTVDIEAIGLAYVKLVYSDQLKNF